MQRPKIHLYMYINNRDFYCCASGHLHLKDDAKMSKSLGNTISVSRLLKSNSADHFRLFCMLRHYRSSKLNKSHQQSGVDVLYNIERWCIVVTSLRASCQFRSAMLSDVFLLDIEFSWEEMQQAKSIIAQWISFFAAAHHYIESSSSKPINEHYVYRRLVIGLQLFSIKCLTGYTSKHNMCTCTCIVIISIQSTGMFVI